MSKTIKRKVKFTNETVDGINYTVEEVDAEIFVSDVANEGDGDVVVTFNGVSIDLSEIKNILDDLEYLNRQRK